MFFFLRLPTFLSCFFLGSSSCVRLVKWALILLILKSRCSGAISIGSYPPILVVGMKVRYSQFKICCCNPGGNCCWVVDPMYPLDLFWSLFFWMLPKARVHGQWDGWILLQFFGSFQDDSSVDRSACHVRLTSKCLVSVSGIAFLTVVLSLNLNPCHGTHCEIQEHGHVHVLFCKL